jgi:hypothetical protein
MGKMLTTLGQQGAWWPLLEAYEVEEFGIPHRKAWGTGHCVRIAAFGQGWRTRLQVEERGDVQVWREALEEMARYGRIWTPGSA